ncbi:MAG: DUF885 domain-containing protein [Chthoniobacterales bacterium]
MSGGTPSAPTKPHRAVACFHKAAAEYLAETHERFPESASPLGLAKFNSRLGRNAVGDYRDQNTLVSRVTSEIEALPEAVFRGDDYLDRRGLLADLRTSAVLDGDFERWRKNPQISVDQAIESIFDLVVRHSDNLKKVLPAIDSRLTEIPRYLRNGASALQKPVPLWTQLATKSCDGGVEFLRGLEEPLTAASPHPAGTRKALGRAIAALENYAKVIVKKTPGRTGDFCIGSDALATLVRERMGFDQSIAELEADGWELIAQLRSELKAEAKRGGFRDARSALDAAAAGWMPDRPLIDEYRAVTKDIHERLRELDLVTLPEGESLDVLPVPDFLRHHFPTAAYHQPPAFSRRQVGIFWVNDLSLTQTDPKKKRAEISQHFGVELTAAHEAYPGHHLQFAIQNRHPSKLRRLFAHAIFYEGWTLWCEKMCAEEGLVRLPQARLIQLHDALWRAHRIVIDCGLHTGKLSYGGAVQLLMEGVGFTRRRAQGDVNWYTSSPTVPMSYLLGRLEVERLHNHFVGGEGWTLKQFNDWMLSHGAIPWRWIMDARVRG